MWLFFLGGAAALPNPTKVRVDLPNGGVEAMASSGCSPDYVEQLPVLLAELERCEGSYTVQFLAESGDFGPPSETSSCVGDCFQASIHAFPLSLRSCWERVVGAWPRAASLQEPTLGVCSVDIWRWPTPGGGEGSLPLSETPVVRGQVAFTTEDRAYEPSVRRYVAQLHYCYDQRLKENPNIQGELSVNGTIDRGRPKFKVTVDELGDPELTSCVLRKMERWTFSTDGLLSVDFRFSRAP